MHKTSIAFWVQVHSIVSIIILSI